MTHEHIMLMFEKRIRDPARGLIATKQQKRLVEVICGMTDNEEPPETLRQIEKMLKDGVNPSTYDYNVFLLSAGKNYSSPVHYAARKGLHKVMGLLLKYGANPNAFDRYNVSAVHLAAHVGSTQCLKMLLSKGADASCQTLVMSEDVRRKAELSYKREDFDDITEDDFLDDIYASESKFDLAHLPYLEKTTPLHLAARKNKPECCRILLNYAADCNATDENGETPLFLAASKGFPDCVLMILKHAVSYPVLSIPNKENTTPLHACFLHGKKKMNECIRELVRHKADIGVHNGQRESAVLLAIKKRWDIDVIKFMLLHGYGNDFDTGEQGKSKCDSGDERIQPCLLTLAVYGYNDEAEKPHLKVYDDSNIRIYGPHIVIRRNENLAAFYISLGMYRSKHRNVLMRELRRNHPSDVIVQAVMATYAYLPRLRGVDLFGSDEEYEESLWLSQVSAERSEAQNTQPDTGDQSGNSLSPRARLTGLASQSVGSSRVFDVGTRPSSDQDDPEATESDFENDYGEEEEEEEENIDVDFLTRLCDRLQAGDYNDNTGDRLIPSIQEDLVKKLRRSIVPGVNLSELVAAECGSNLEVSGERLAAVIREGLATSFRTALGLESGESIDSIIAMGPPGASLPTGPFGNPGASLPSEPLGNPGASLPIEFRGNLVTGLRESFDDNRLGENLDDGFDENLATDFHGSFDGRFPADPHGRPTDLRGSFDGRFPTDLGRFPTGLGGSPGGNFPTDLGGRFPTDLGGRSPTDLGGRSPFDLGGRFDGRFFTDLGGRFPTDLHGSFDGRPPTDLGRSFDGQPPTDLGGYFDARPPTDFGGHFDGRPPTDFGRSFDGTPRTDLGRSFDGRPTGVVGRFDGRPTGVGRFDGRSTGLGGRFDGRPTGVGGSFPTDLRGSFDGRLPTGLHGRLGENLGSHLWENLDTGFHETGGLAIDLEEDFRRAIEEDFLGNDATSLRGNQAEELSDRFLATGIRGSNNNDFHETRARGLRGNLEEDFLGNDATSLRGNQGEELFDRFLPMALHGRENKDDFLDFLETRASRLPGNHDEEFLGNTAAGMNKNRATGFPGNGATGFPGNDAASFHGNGAAGFPGNGVASFSGNGAPRSDENDDTRFDENDNRSSDENSDSDGHEHYDLTNAIQYHFPRNYVLQNRAPFYPQNHPPSLLARGRFMSEDAYERHLYNVETMFKMRNRRGIAENEIDEWYYEANGWAGGQPLTEPGKKKKQYIQQRYQLPSLAHLSRSCIRDALQNKVGQIVTLHLPKPIKEYILLGQKLPKGS